MKMGSPWRYFHARVHLWFHQERKVIPWLSTRKNHTSALHFQGTKWKMWAHPRFSEKVSSWIVTKCFFIMLDQLSMPPKYLNFSKNHKRIHQLWLDTLELIFLNYGSAIDDSYPSACYLIAYCVEIYLLMEAVKELWDHFADSFERQNIAWDKTWSSSTDADLISSTYSLVRQHAWQA